VLLNDGKGNYSWTEPKLSGLSLRGAVKDIKEITTTTGKRMLLITVNDQLPALYQLKK
jgi:hypothetical protein